MRRRSGAVLRRQRAGARPLFPIENSIAASLGDKRTKGLIMLLSPHSHPEPLTVSGPLGIVARAWLGGVGMAVCPLSLMIRGCCSWCRRVSRSAKWVTSCPGLNHDVGVSQRGLKVGSLLGAKKARRAREQSRLLGRVVPPPSRLGTGRTRPGLLGLRPLRRLGPGRHARGNLSAGAQPPRLTSEHSAPRRCVRSRSRSARAASRSRSASPARVRTGAAPSAATPR